MFKRIRNALVALVGAATLMVAPVAVPAIVSAQDIQGCLAQGSNFDTQGNGDTCNGNKNVDQGGSHIETIIRVVVNVFSLIVGVVAVIMIILGGLRYITSGGDSNNVSSAKNTIIYAIIGLVVVALAQFIVQFVLNKVITP